MRATLISTREINENGQVVIASIYGAVVNVEMVSYGALHFIDFDFHARWKWDHVRQHSFYIYEENSFDDGNFKFH